MWRPSCHSFGNAKCLVFSGQQFIEGRDSCVSYVHKEEYLGDICQGSVLKVLGPGHLADARGGQEKVQLIFKEGYSDEVFIRLHLCSFLILYLSINIQYWHQETIDL